MGLTESTLDQMNQAYSMATPARAREILLTARAIPDAYEEPEEKRRAASLFLWRNDPHFRMAFTRFLHDALSPTVSDEDAERAIEWCARRAWCDVSAARVEIAMKARATIYRQKGRI